MTDFVAQLSSIANTEPWVELAICAQVDPELFWPEKGNMATAALKICGSKEAPNCPVREKCLEYALARGECGGVWGGTTQEMRKKLRRNRRRPPNECANGHDITILGRDSIGACRQCVKERQHRRCDRGRIKRGLPPVKRSA